MDSVGNARITRSQKTDVMETSAVGSKNMGYKDELPDGWIREDRYRANGTGNKLRKDPFYFEPDGEYEFRSLKDVYRYLETKDIKSCIMRPTKRRTNGIHTIQKECREEKSSEHAQLNASDDNIQMVLEKSSNESDGLFASELPNINSIPSVSDGVPAQHGEDIVIGTPINSGEGFDTERLPSSVLKKANSNKPQAKDGGISERSAPSLPMEDISGKPYSGKLRSSSKTHDIDPQPSSRKTKTTKQITPPLRASPRLAALKTNEVAGAEPDEHPRITKRIRADELPPSPVNTVKRKTKAASLSVTEQPNGQYSTSSSGKLKNKDVQAEQSSGKIENQDMLTEKSTPPKQDASSSGQLENKDMLTEQYPGKIVSQDMLAEQSTPAKQSKTVETANDNAGSTASLPLLFGTGWLDPCIEFAFKTLTGDIPYLDDTAAVANYFSTPQASEKGATANCLTSPYDNSRNHTQNGLTAPTDKLSTGNGYRPHYGDSAAQRR